MGSCGNNLMKTLMFVFNGLVWVRHMCPPISAFRFRSKPLYIVSPFSHFKDLSLYPSFKLGVRNCTDHYWHRGPGRGQQLGWHHWQQNRWQLDLFSLASISQAIVTHSLTTVSCLRIVTLLSLSPRIHHATGGWCVYSYCRLPRMLWCHEAEHCHASNRKCFGDCKKVSIYRDQHSNTITNIPILL